MNWYHSIKIAEPLPTILNVPKSARFPGQTFNSLNNLIDDEQAKKEDELYGKQKYLGQGSYGIASQVGQDQVVKYTTDPTEYNAAIELLKIQKSYSNGTIPGVVKVFDARKLGDKNYQKVYAIVLEKVFPLIKTEIDIVHYLNKQRYRS